MWQAYLRYAPVTDVHPMVLVHLTTYDKKSNRYRNRETSVLFIRIASRKFLKVFRKRMPIRLIS